MAQYPSQFSKKNYQDTRFADLQEEQSVLHQICFENCIFERCVFDCVQWKQCHFDQCTFRDCCLLNVKLDRSRFHNVQFIRCKLVGLNFAQLDKRLFFSLLLEKSKIMACSFPHTDMRQCQLIDCEMDDCFFDGADLRALDFSGMNFGGSRFTHCRLQESNFGMRLVFCSIPGKTNLKVPTFR